MNEKHTLTVTLISNDYFTHHYIKITSKYCLIRAAAPAAIGVYASTLLKLFHKSLRTIFVTLAEEIITWNDYIGFDLPSAVGPLR